MNAMNDNIARKAPSPRLRKAAQLAADANVFACPVCEAAMAVQENTSPALACASGHSFDFARQGYVNLLLSNQKKSLTPGYTVQMLEARRTMLERGIFCPVSRLVADALYERSRAITRDGKALILDAGTGEGHLFSDIARSAAQQLTARVVGVGFDISRAGIKLACRFDTPIMWCVANAMRSLPFATAAFDAAMSILAPGSESEFRRVVRPGGYLVRVTTGPEHLSELRKAIYADPPQEKNSDQRSEDVALAGFCLEDSQQLRYSFPVGPELTASVIRMNPLFWKAPADRVANTIKRGLPDVTIDLVMTVWRRLTP